MSSQSNMDMDARRCRLMAQSETDLRVRATLVALAEHLEGRDGQQEGSRRHC
jgi:hypothetical protein